MTTSKRVLRETVEAYERVYGFPSAELETRIRDGELNVDQPVLDWLLRYYSLQVIQIMEDDGTTDD